MKDAYNTGCLLLKRITDPKPVTIADEFLSTRAEAYVSSMNEWEAVGAVSALIKYSILHPCKLYKAWPRKDKITSAN